jgi:2-polyprenyl-3-methyl-5-hydroxy-6-metoxy-1,4-benzoquinol methylase
MHLTAPQSSHYDASRFDQLSPRENHFDWDLYYRFKDQRERFWRERLDRDASFRALATDHFTAFQRSIDATMRLLEPFASPRVLDIGLSSEQLDRAILKRTRGHVTVLDLQPPARESYERAFGGRGAFVLDDVISFARVAANREQYDLVYSIGLIEHFPDKTDILDAHVQLTSPGGVLLLYAPIDTDTNRRLTGLACEWENFGHRELLTPDELQAICAHPDLEILAAEPVGFLSAVWARKVDRSERAA